MGETKKMAKFLKYLFFNYCNILIITNNKKKNHEKVIINNKYQKCKIKYRILGKWELFLFLK